MALGPSAANWANKALDVLAGTSFTAPANTFVRLHTADPGASGTTAGSANTTRQQIVWAAASAGAKAMSGSLSWTAWAAGTETISHISIWDASTGGNFLWSVALSTPRTVNNGDTFTLSSLSLSVTGLAA